MLRSNMIRYKTYAVLSISVPIYELTADAEHAESDFFLIVFR